MSEQISFKKNTDLAIKLVVFSTAAALLLLVIYQLRVILLSLFGAMVLASAVAPLAESAERKKIPRIVTVLAVYALALLVYGVLAVCLAPALIEQWQKLCDNLPSYWAGLQGLYQSALQATGDRAEALAINFDDVRSLSGKLLQKTLSVTANFIALLVNGGFILFLSGYFVVEAKNIWSALFKWLPPHTREVVTRLIAPLEKRIGGYVRGQIMVAFCVAVFLTTAFTLLGLNYALLLGLLAGILNVVPYVGSLISVLFAIVIAFNQTPLLALAVLAVYGLEQWVESTVMVPFLVGKEVDLHPLIILFAILCGGTLMGVAGALVAIPAAAAAILLAEEFYLKRATPETQESAAKTADESATQSATETA